MRGVDSQRDALIYQDRSGSEVRSTLAIVFVVGTVISLGSLAIFGRVGPEHLLLSLELLPALLLGLWGARFVAGLLSGRWLRPAILLFASGIVAVLFGVIG